MRALLALLLLMLTFPMAAASNGRLALADTVVKVEIEGRGDLLIKLYTKEAPRTTAHFLKLVRQGFYSGQRFHRVETSPRPYLVQIGDPASKSGDLDQPGMGGGGSGARIPFENTGFANVVGAVGLSRPVNDRDAGDSQFYMLLDRANFLDGNYTVFGQVTAGLDVLKKIRRGDRVSRVSIVSGG